MTQPDARLSARVSASFTATIKYKGNNNEVWKENARIISISRNGAGFILQRECQVGRLLSLLLPLPKHLRCYDTDKELYRIWGLVQHCNEIKTEDGGNYHVGVAFVGKDMPPGYSENHLQSYKISGVTKEGLWDIIPTEKPFVVRKHPRFWVALDVWLELVDTPEEDEFVKEKTVTENISISGAAIFSNLDIEVDECLTFTSKDHDFSALAVVRQKITANVERPKLHIEFLNARFPVEKLVMPSE